MSKSWNTSSWNHEILNHEILLSVGEKSSIPTSYDSPGCWQEFWKLNLPKHFIKMDKDVDDYGNLEYIQNLDNLISWQNSRKRAKESFWFYKRTIVENENYKTSWWPNKCSHFLSHNRSTVFLGILNPNLLTTFFKIFL